MNNYALLFCLLLTLFPVCHGDTFYKWRDENGNWHFSDRAPDNHPVEERHTDASRINTSETGKATRELREVFREETPEETAYGKQRETQENLEKARKQQWCDEARRRLETLRGRVVFLDRDGQAKEVTEEEREARANDLARRVARHCG